MLLVEFHLLSYILLYILYISVCCLLVVRMIALHHPINELTDCSINFRCMLTKLPVSIYLLLHVVHLASLHQGISFKNNNLSFKSVCSAIKLSTQCRVICSYHIATGTLQKNKSNNEKSQLYYKNIHAQVLFVFNDQSATNKLNLKRNCTKLVYSCN